jgi:transformation/transcription domain-associated protein
MIHRIFAPIQLLRNTILEILHRLPALEQVKQLYSDVVSMMTTVLREDNEENGVVAVKVIMDANRAFKRDMDTHVQAFLDFVRDLYLNMNQAVHDLLSEDSPGPPPSQSAMSINTSVSV